jgi:hypothetical protein
VIFGTVGSTFILNLFFGLSGVGYALAFFYACGPTRRDLWLAAERERLSVAADLAVVAMERRSREALEYRGQAKDDAAGQQNGCQCQ